MKNFVVSEADWAGRDTVMGFGNDDANIRLADMLLNLGYSDESEIALEGEGGTEELESTARRPSSKFVGSQNPFKSENES